MYNKTETQEIVQQLFESNEENNEENENNASKEISEEKLKENAKIKIEIINGSGIDSSLAAVETLLKKQGYTISKTSTTKTETKNTAIINNTKIESNIVEDIKNTLNTGVIQNSTNTSSKVDITIIIGTNYNK